MTHPTAKSQRRLGVALLPAFALIAVAALATGCCEIPTIPTGGQSLEATVTIPSGEPTFSAQGGVVIPGSSESSESDLDSVFPDEFGQFNSASAGGTKNQLPGPASATVPNVVGLSLSAAKSKIEAAGFKYYVMQRPDLQKNRVHEQYPRAGATADTGSEVQVTTGI